MAGVVKAMRQLRERIAASDVAELDGAGIQALLADIRSTERALTSLRVQAGQQSDRLAAEGLAPDASEAFLGRGEVSGSTARNDARRARIAAAIPSLGEALAEGTMGGEHLDAMATAAKRVDDELRPLFDAAAADLVERSGDLPVDTFKKQAQRLADKVTNDHGRAQAARQRAASELSTWTDRNGMGHLKATLDPEWFESVTSAIAKEAASMAASAKDAGEPIERGRHLDAAAFVELVQHGNGRKGRSEVLVVVDADSLTNGPSDTSLRETRNGAELSFDTIERLCCDADIQPVAFDASGATIDVGHRYRTATAIQWSALNAMYSTCAWAGCDAPVSWCQAHHIHEWEHGGATDLDNLLPLCSRHHHAVHEGQWSVKLLPDRTLRIFRPDGTHHADARPDRSERFAERAGPPRHRAQRKRSDN